MKKTLLGMVVGMSLYADVSVKYLGTENPAGGAHTWFDTYLVTKDGKECVYEYSVGVYNGIITNQCTKKSHTFVFRPDKPYAKPIKYKKKKYIDPWLYNMAYNLITKETKKEATDKTITSSKNSKGQTIYCSKELKTCKTEKEVLNYIWSKKH